MNRADLEGAEQLLTTPDAEGVPITAAFWLFPTDQTGWQFAIASPTVATEGAAPILRRAQEVLERQPAIHMTLDQIVVLKANDPVVLTLRTVVPPGYPIQDWEVTVPVRHYASYLPDSAATATLYVLRLAREETPAGRDRQAS